jgi:hypothetical protein
MIRRARSNQARASVLEGTARICFGKPTHSDGRSCMREIVFVLLLALMAHYAWGQTDTPNTPAGRALQAWLNAVNSGKTAKIEAYVRYIDPTQTVDWLVSLSQHSGGFSLLSVTSKEPQQIVECSEPIGVSTIELSRCPAPSLSPRSCPRPASPLAPSGTMSE